MINKLSSVFALVVLVALLGCQENEVVQPSTYACVPAVGNAGQAHPKAAQYQAILDKNRKLGIVGASLMIKDKYGIWVGASGKADVASGINVQPCNRFLIASISKVFTAAAVFRYVDRKSLTLDDPVTKWIDPSVAKKVANAEQSTIRHLLNHTSGMPDYYTLQYDLDRLNRVYNGSTQEQTLTYVYGKKATNGVGESFSYSNTNYLLLGMILEKVSGQSLEQVYQKEIFQPLGLMSAYYSAKTPIPADAVKGYADMYGNGKYVESKFLYKDELITGDGGIAINAYDVGVFFEQLMKGKLISEASLSSMTDWFDLPAEEADKNFEFVGHFQNGQGLERNKTPHGISVGHTGGIDGFLSIAQYFPETDRTIVLLINSASYDGTPRLNIYRESLKVMFE